MSTGNGQGQGTAPGVPAPERRNQLARELAHSHAKWWKEFGHTYMFFFSQETGLSPDEAYKASGLLWLFEMKGEVHNQLAVLTANQAQGLEMLALLLQGFMQGAEMGGADGTSTG